MAEDSGAQNQGKKSQSDQPNEAGGEVLDQKKADRAAKERERRRRRRRRKAELRRLERETLEQQPGALKPETSPEPEPKPEKKPEPKPPEPEPTPEQALELEPVPVQPEVQPLPKPKAPRKKANPRTPKEPEDRHVVPRSEEHAPRSKDIVPQAEPEEEHPLSHKTHSFAGPLIEPGAEPENKPQTEPAPQETAESFPLPPPPVPPAEPEPAVEPAPEPPAPEPVVPEQDIVIHDEHEEKRPSVNMGELHEEEHIPGVHPIFPEEPEKEKVEEPEVIEPIKEPPRKPIEDKKKHEKQEAAKENAPESEGLNERKSFSQAAGGFSAGVIKNIGTAFHNFRLKFKLRNLVVFLILVVVGGGLYAGYLFKVHEKVYNYVAEFFKAPPPVEVHVDPQLLNQWGITTAMIFGDNWGSTKDLLASQLYNAYFFGKLKEPSVQGETGITALYYYGKGLDLNAETNQFMAYINNLRELVSSYDVDVYAMLDQTTQRDQSLDAYLTKLKDIQDKSTTIVKEINAEIDDLKISYDSLNPDRTKFETDFFVALKGLAAEKSDFLLKSFTDVTQKQAAIKAREAALVQLLAYYTSSMQKLAIRISAVEKNRQALVQGIHVVDIPGANLDIIIKENP